MRVNPRKRAVGRGRAAGPPAGAACARAWRRGGHRPAARPLRPGGAAARPARVPPAPPPAAAREPRPCRAHAERATPEPYIRTSFNGEINISGNPYFH